MLILICAALWGASACPASAVTDEQWITTFVRFVDWPASPADNVIVVCHRHDAPSLALDGTQVRGMTLHVVSIKRPRDAARCHVFSALSEREVDWQPWLATLPSRSTLVLGSGARFCELGGAICVVKDDPNAAQKYQVNLDAIARAGLKVRMPLLRHQRTAKPDVQ